MSIRSGHKEGGGHRQPDCYDPDPQQVGSSGVTDEAGGDVGSAYLGGRHWDSCIPCDQVGACEREYQGRR